MRRVALATVLALATLLLPDFIWGFLFETNDDLSFSWLMWGREGLPPRGDFFWFFRGGLGQALSALHQLVGPHAYTLSGALLLALATGRWYSSCLLGTGEPPDRRRRLALCGIAAAVLAWSLRLLNFTRVTIVVSFLAGSLLLRDRDLPLRRDRLAWLDLALVAIAWMVRPKAALWGLALALMARLLRAPSRQAVARWAALVLVLAGYVAVTDWFQTSELEKEFIARQPYANALLNQAVPLERPEDPGQRFRLQFLLDWFLFDEAIFETRFLRKHLPPPDELQRRHLARAGASLRETAGSIAEHAPPGLLLLLAWLVIEAGLAGGWRRLAAAVAWVAGILAGLLALGVLVWMRPRVLESSLALAALALLGWNAEDGTSPGRTRRTLVVLALTSLGLAWTGWRETTNRRRLTRLASRARYASRMLEEALADRRVLMLRGRPLEHTLYFLRPLSLRFLSRDIPVIPLQGWMSQSPAFRAMVDRYGGGPGAGVAGLIEDIQAHPERYAMVGERRWAELFLAYIHSEYGVRLVLRREQRGGVPYYLFVSPGA